MPIRRRLILCHHCFVPLSPDERGHYVYQCHACVVLEHDSMRLAAADPDGPEAESLQRGPVDLGWRPPDRERKIDA